MEEAPGSGSTSDVHPLSQSADPKGSCEDPQGPLQGSVCRPIGCTEEESTQNWLASLTNMTLKKVVLPA